MTALMAEGILEREIDRARCHESFTALVTRQSRFVFQVAYAVLRNVSDAEDVVQETFLKLYRTRRWWDIENERAFLARATWRIAVDRLRRIGADAPELDVQADEQNPEQAAIASNWSATVHRLIDALPEELRQPLALSAVDDLNSHEIAVIMGIPPATVRSRLSRSRQILKQKLEAFMAGANGHGTNHR